MSQKDAAVIWGKACKVLQDVLRRDVYSRWIEVIQPLSLADKLLTAALDFAKANADIARGKRERDAMPCEEYGGDEPGDHDRCGIHIPPERKAEWCESCRNREDIYMRISLAKHLRSLARKRIVRLGAKVLEGGGR